VFICSVTTAAPPRRRGPLRCSFAAARMRVGLSVGNERGSGSPVPSEAVVADTIALTDVAVCLVNPIGGDISPWPVGGGGFAADVTAAICGPRYLVSDVAAETVFSVGSVLAKNTLPKSDQSPKSPGSKIPPRWRWAMLAILCVDICVSYLPNFTFVPILSQSMRVYGVEESHLNVLCILYAFVYVPCAFLTGPVIGAVGCRWTFILAMALTSGGCLLRCGPQFVRQLLGGHAPSSYISVAAATVVDGRQGGSGSGATHVISFTWLVVGQAFCALGQPFLVNSTSQIGAEWFPPQERPAAAMVSNLMNFLGASLSFVLPPFIVEEDSLHLAAAGGTVATAFSGGLGGGDRRMEAVLQEQMTRLMQMQLVFAMVGLALTAVFFQSGPPEPVLHAHRQPIPFITEARSVLSSRDFWRVNGQFMIYVSVCHSFDAIEGALLERYGFSAALSSWTAVSCAVASIGSTVVESMWIKDATSYTAALVVVNFLLGASQLLCFLCLQFQLPSLGFVFAVGIMGLATPGWGCSFELGSEVCFPAREATVSSILEACSNLTGVIGIVVMQGLIDAGLGAWVLVLTGTFSFLGGFLLLGLSGRLRRSEAEARAEAEEFGCSKLDFPNPEAMPANKLSLLTRWASTLCRRLSLSSWTSAGKSTATPTAGFATSELEFADGRVPPPSLYGRGAAASAAASSATACLSPLVDDELGCGGPEAPKNTKSLHK